MISLAMVYLHMQYVHVSKKKKVHTVIDPIHFYFERGLNRHLIILWYSSRKFIIIAALLFGSYSLQKSVRMTSSPGI